MINSPRAALLSVHFTSHGMRKFVFIISISHHHSRVLKSTYRKYLFLGKAFMLTVEWFTTCAYLVIRNMKASACMSWYSGRVASAVGCNSWILKVRILRSKIPVAVVLLLDSQVDQIHRLRNITLSLKINHSVLTCLINLFVRAFSNKYMATAAMWAVANPSHLL